MKLSSAPLMITTKKDWLYCGDLYQSSERMYSHNSLPKSNQVQITREKKLFFEEEIWTEAVIMTKLYASVKYLYCYLKWWAFTTLLQKIIKFRLLKTITLLWGWNLNQVITTKLDIGMPCLHWPLEVMSSSPNQFPLLNREDNKLSTISPIRIKPFLNIKGTSRDSIFQLSLFSTLADIFAVYRPLLFSKLIH